MNAIASVPLPQRDSGLDKNILKIFKSCQPAESLKRCTGIQENFPMQILNIMNIWPEDERDRKR
ncbi:hypothetical protein CLU84_1735 [Comamonas sp. 26]|nr:hypothetical protein CLU84_1735 [Comamonas sp. 26]